MSPSVSLAAVVEPLEPALRAGGLKFVPGENGVSSGGSFSSGYLVGGRVRIGLIMRGTALGLPVYEWGKHKAGHDDVVRLLGRADSASLQWDPGEFRVFGRNGLEPAAALLEDLSSIILPCLRDTPDALTAAVAAAHKAWLRHMGL